MKKLDVYKLAEIFLRQQIADWVQRADPTETDKAILQQLIKQRNEIANDINGMIAAEEAKAKAEERRNSQSKRILQNTHFLAWMNEKGFTKADVSTMNSELLVVYYSYWNMNN